MEWLWIIQLFINVIVVMALIVRWRERSPVSAAVDDGLSSGLSRQWETDLSQYRRKTEDQLRFLVGLCEQAHSILMRHAQTAQPGTASLEEEELKALRQSPVAAAVTRNIPSVQDLEAKKKAARAEIPLDLRSLLRDQLT